MIRVDGISHALCTKCMQIIVKFFLRRNFIFWGVCIIHHDPTAALKSY